MRGAGREEKGKKRKAASRPIRKREREKEDRKDKIKLPPKKHILFFISLYISYIKKTHGFE